jgi:hypothetical protein
VKVLNRAWRRPDLLLTCISPGCVLRGDFEEAILYSDLEIVLRIQKWEDSSYILKQKEEFSWWVSICIMREGEEIIMIPELMFKATRKMNFSVTEIGRWKNKQIWEQGNIKT